MKARAALLLLALLLTGCAGDEGGADAAYPDGRDGGIQPPQCERRILEDEVNNRGGIEAYLLSTGILTVQLEVMRAEAVKDE